MIQTRFTEMRNVAMDALMALIDDAAAARKAGATDASLKTTWEHQRRAQFFLDFAEAENSTGFHAPQESMRILGQSVDSSRKGQLELRNRK